MTSPIIFNHDAAIDEYMATVLLTTLEDFETQGFVITNADCIADVAMDTQWKFHLHRKLVKNKADCGDKVFTIYLF